MAVATGTDVDVVRRKPYARVLWTFLHIEQQEYLDGLQQRSRALYAAMLTNFAMHEPKHLVEENRKFSVEAGLVAPVEVSRDSARALLADMQRADQLGAWKVMGEVA